MIPIIPLIFIVGLAYAGYSIGRKVKRAEPIQPVRTAGYVPTVEAYRRNQGFLPPRRPDYMPNPGMVNPTRPHLTKVLRMMGSGQTPSTWLVNQAIREAFDIGDWSQVMNLTRQFHSDDLVNIPQTASDDSQPIDDNASLIESDLHDIPTSAETVAKVGSPFDNVDQDDWDYFVDQMRTKQPGWTSERHVGQFEQNKARLKSLGLPDPTDDDSEHQALANDMADYRESEYQLISDNAGDVVNIDGVDHAITESGILGLLKCAGPSGARSWLVNPDDRKRFPKTTETFIKVNGCF